MRNTPLKAFAKSPLKDSGHGGKKGHGHTTVFGMKVPGPSGKEILKNVKKYLPTKEGIKKQLVDPLNIFTTEARRVKKKPFSRGISKTLQNRL